jgi:[glutamine synthetase] adenylyltransferase / [glutamine synthetase]-adenylyl-L-tyrosine phosphorylase
MAPSSSDFAELIAATDESPIVHDRLFFVGFSDWQMAHRRLRQMAGTGDCLEAFRDGLPTLLHTLSEAPNPDLALLNFERLAAAVPDRVALFQTFVNQPRSVEILCRLFVGSQFLSEILISNPGYLEPLTQHRLLAELKSVQQFQAEAEVGWTTETTLDERWSALRRFQRRELLRLGICDFFGLLDLRRVTTQLSLLADALIRVGLALVTPPDLPVPLFAVIALGKLGGEELNYSSDIDLLFIAREPHPALTRVGQQLIKGLTTAAADGFLYRVDMRLRPWGRSGELVASLAAYSNYLETQAQVWEKQALLKARVCAGDFSTGRQFLKEIGDHIFTATPEVARDAIRKMKQKIEGELLRKGREWGEVKLGRGSIRDIEFLCQYLQLVNGAQEPAVRSFNTLDALVRLTDLGFLQADEYRMLSDAYVFLRTIEHALQLVHNKQTHELPRDPDELLALARRLDFGSDSQFLDHFSRHCAAARRVFARYVGETSTTQAALPVLTDTPPSLSLARRSGTVSHVARLAPTYQKAFTPREIEGHVALIEALSPDNPVRVEALPLPEDKWSVTVVGFDFHGELSLITGLLLAHGFNVLDGQVFTYSAVEATSSPSPGDLGPGDRTPREQQSSLQKRRLRRDQATLPASLPGLESAAKIVDVFTVRATHPGTTQATWRDYSTELDALVRQTLTGHLDDAHGKLVKRVAATLRRSALPEPNALYPIEIDIDNDLSERDTVLLIRTRDTLGFLYELTSALSLSGVSINRLQVGYALGDACDTIYVTDTRGQKITDPIKQRELITATVLIKHFTHLLPHSPNPEAALLHFRDFLSQLFLRPNWPDEVADLERPIVLQRLARLLGVSDFLWNDFLRMQHENLFPLVREVDALVAPKTRDQLEVECAATLDAAGSNWRAALNDFRDREMFRVDMRQILGHVDDFARFSEELSDVAEVTVIAAVTRCEAELAAQYGRPRLGPTGPAYRMTAARPCQFSVCALGKCGGREMGFASDIELMFVYAGEGATSGPESIAASVYFTKLVDAFLHSLKTRREGVFEIDLRLRPYGRAGSLAVSLGSFREYFGPEGDAWPFERQALVKLRPLCGDPAFGGDVIALRDRLIYTAAPFDVAAMRGMRERQLRQLVTPGQLNAKLSPGGLVDLEYLVQGLQISHGHNRPALRSPNTLEALAALQTAGFISQDDASAIHEAYLFLRTLISGLRMVRGNARELTVPLPDSEEFAFLCRRLGHDDPGRIYAQLQQHTTAIRVLSQRLLK